MERCGWRTFEMENAAWCPAALAAGDYHGSSSKPFALAARFRFLSVSDRLGVRARLKAQETETTAKKNISGGEFAGTAAQRISTFANIAMSKLFSMTALSTLQDIIFVLLNGATHGHAWWLRLVTRCFK